MKRLPKQLISMLVVLCMVMSFFGVLASAETTTTATLVTDVSSLKAGDQIIIAAAEKDYALSTTQNSNNRGQASITRVDASTITVGEDAQIITLEAGTVDGTFAFNVGESQYLYAASSSKNYLRTGTLNDNGSWAITIDASTGVASVIASGTNTRNVMKYNSSSGLFACYASGQQDVSIYKVTGSSEGDGGTDEPVVEPTGYTATLVTDGTSLNAGDQIIIVAAESDFALSTTQNSNNRGQSAVVKGEDGTVTYYDDTQIITLAEGAAAGTLAMTVGEAQYLYAPSSSSNHLKTTAELTENASWTINVDAATGIASIVAAGTNTRNTLRYNSTSSLFSCYAESNTMKDICIYMVADTEGTGGATGGTGEDDTDEPVVELVGTATLVTDGTILNAGDQIIIVAAESDFALSATQNSNNRGQAAVVRDENGVVSYYTDAQVITLAEGAVAGTLAMSVGESQYLYAVSTSSNYLRTTDTLDENGSWTINVDATTGAASIVAAGTNTRNTLRYNSTSGLFSCYDATNSQMDICIYMVADTEGTGGATGGTITGGTDEPVVSDYYLIGYINGADYGCNDDYENLGQYKFVDGTLVATFDIDSYVFIKTGDNANWYMTSSYVSDTTATFYNTTTGASEKMFVPGGVELSFTLVENEDGSLTLTYAGDLPCKHPSHTVDGICTDCAATVEHSYVDGICSICGAEKVVEPDAAYYVASNVNGWIENDSNYQMSLYNGIYQVYMDVPNGKLELKVTDGTWDNTWPQQNYVAYVGAPSTICVNFNPVTEEITIDGIIECTHESHNADRICTACGMTVDHSYVDGTCSICGTIKEYYLHGYINGADYYENGLYFTDGRLLCYFDCDSYVYIVDSDGNAYMTESFVDGISGTFVQGGTEKMLLRGNEQHIIDLYVNEDGSLTLELYQIPEESVVVPTLTLKYPTLAFEAEILYNAYFTVDDATSVEEYGMITFASKLADGTIDDALEIIPGYTSVGDSYVVSSNGVPAKNLGDALYFKVYAKLSDGTYAYSEVGGFNAIAYARTILNNASSSAKAKALVVAMLNYGAAAQTYFGYNTDNLMNASLTAEQLALVEEYNSSMVNDVVSADSSKVGIFTHNGGYTRIYPTVSFQGAFAINYYFTTKYTPDTAPTFYIWDSATYNSVDVLTPENAIGTIDMVLDGTQWAGVIEGIAAKSVDETYYTAAIYYVGDTMYTSPVIAYSLGTYCKTVAESGEAFGAATAVYGYYAKAYFA